MLTVYMYTELIRCVLTPRVANMRRKNIYTNKRKTIKLSLYMANIF